MNLLDIKNNDRAVIKSIPEGEAGERLEALGLRTGKEIQKISGMPFEGPITLMLDGRHFAVAHGIAEQIEVESVHENENASIKKSSAWPKFI